MKKFLYFSFFILSSIQYLQALPFDEAAYQQRLQDYRNQYYNNGRVSSIPMQAFLKQPVDQAAIQSVIDRINTNGEFDFNLVQFIRVLFFSNGEYDDQLLPVIQSVPLWLTPNEKVRVYWSENHVMMWLSSQWLLHEKYGWEVDSNLRSNLVHDLDLKIQYGYYEFFSTVYFPFTLTGLLNLVDFAQDDEIRTKAIAATNRLLKEILMLVNDQGVFYPASGRNYSGKFSSPYGQNHSDIIYLLTGLGRADGDSHSAAFLSTSSLDVKDIVNSWQEKENTVLTMGHPLEMTKSLHQGMSEVDKTIFQWSGGMYLHPDFALETAKLIDGYGLWDHKEFATFSMFKGLPVQLAPTIAKVAASLSKSSVLTGAKVAIYKNKSITLSSIQDYWKGRSGYQQWPWAANTGTIPTLTVSGRNGNIFVNEDQNANSNLPYIQQKDNLALIMYRPNKDLALFGMDNHDVTLLWQDSLYDEVREYKKWIIGREGDSYVAVLRHCTDEVDGVYTCDDQDGQLWACVVGNQDLYGSFENFVHLVESAKYQEKWTLVLNKLEWHYFGMVEFDGNHLEYDWVGDLLSAPEDDQTDPIVTSTANKILSEQSVSLYPNPAKDFIRLEWKGQNAVMDCQLKIYDISGREVYQKSMDILPFQKIEIPIQSLQSGMYQMAIYTPEGIATQKFIVQ